MPDLKSFAAEFPIPKNSLLMNSAAISPLPRSTEKVIHDFVKKLQDEVIFDHVSVFSVVDRCREKLAELMNHKASMIAITGNCASAISQAALGMKLSRGDRILFWDQEYPSNAYPWAVAAEKSGATLEVLPSETNLDLDHSKLLEKIKPGVKVVALSWVQFQSGVTSPLSEIGAACRRVGAYFVVDIFQGLGVIPFDFKKSGVHAACGGSHKWLSGPTGSGYLALDEELFENLEPILVGAHTYNLIGGTYAKGVEPFPDARRFEPGAPSILNLAGWAQSMDLYLKAGIDSIHRHSLGLSQSLIEGLQSRGFAILGDQNFKARQSPIVTFKSMQWKSHDKLYETLAKNRVAYSPRGGGVRLSPHGFNSSDEVAQFFRILDQK